MPRLPRLLLFSLLLGGLARGGTESSPLLVSQEGDLPLVLCAPHGGTLPIPGGVLRKGNGVAKFVAVTDVRTDALARQISDGIRRRTGHTPYLIIAKFSRKYADPNRPSADAYESPAAKDIYDAYHAAVRAACASVQRRWGEGFLVDVHGQAAEPGKIMRGTNDRTTVSHLIARQGEAALTGPQSILGGLAHSGYVIYPLNDSPEKESAHFDGGYTVRTYGSHDGGTFDALQLEFGSKLREPAALPKTADDTAAALCAFLQAYLTVPKPVTAAPTA